ncbi:BamA/TamA family outer membrane protein [Jiulongibacter sp. NS-SX5]|uniref:BamA/TamA family outer membrane protein n=1 Tax=Jiulongibacter sp. NS-SX5 TaxID=3463854 RepID=UPI004059F5F1
MKGHSPFMLLLLVFGLTIDLLGQSTEGDTLYIASIELKGNDKTNSSIIFRELSFELGERRPQAELVRELERSRRNVFNTNLFVTVDAEMETKADSAFITFQMKERLYLLPLPILYLADRSFNEWWYNRNRDLKRVIYGVQVSHSNLTGNADILKLKTYGGFIPYFELSYSRPYIDRRQRMGISGGVFFSTQRSFAVRTWEDKLDFLETEERSRTRRGAFLEYNLRNALYHFHTIYLGYTKMSISDTAARVNPNYFRNAGTELGYATFKYDYRFDKKDNVLYPLDGHVLKASLTAFSSGFAEGTNHLRVGAEYLGFYPLSRKFYGSLKVRGQFSMPQKQLYPFLLGLGYRNTLVRGYELNVIDGQHFGLVQTDLKYQLLKKTFNISRFLKFKQFNSVPVGIYSRAFFDTGYIKNYFPEFSKSSLSNKLLYGYGIGLDISTFYDTVFNINYSVNQSGFNRVYFGVQRYL